MKVDAFNVLAVDGLNAINMGYNFFQNNECEYFPCHKIDSQNRFNCMFCYCPLYMYECMGAYKILSNGIKDCSDCLIPHYNYDYIINKLRAINENKNL